MRKAERTRVREHGTTVTNPADFVDAGLARILAIREVVKECQYAKIDGIMADLYSASAVIKVYDALNETNKQKYRNCTFPKMASIAFKLMQ